MALGTEKDGHRMPQKLVGELRALEKALARELRPLHPLFFQRFDDQQLDRLLRAMPFLRLSSGRWLFGSENLGAEWPATKGDRAFILLKGNIALYPDSQGAGERTDIYRGAVFGEKRFRLGDEGMRDCIAAAAHCEEACMVGVITTAALEAAYSDRAFGNARIAQSWRQVPELSSVCKSEQKLGTEQGTSAANSQKTTPDDNQDKDSSGAVAHGLRDLSKVATTIHLRTGQELICNESLDESVLVVSKGALEVRGDITVTEKLDALPAKKVRIRIHVDRAENLAGDSIFDKLDPYCIVKMGENKKFQTPVLWNVGVNPKFEYNGVFTYQNEESIEFTVMDFDKYSADDLCGIGTITTAELYDGFKGAVKLFRPKRGIFKADDDLEPEFAGKVFIKVTWDYEKVSALSKVAKSKSWKDQELFMLGEQACWGHEHIMLQHLFMRTLEGAVNNMPYTLTLSNIRVLGATQKGGNPVVSCWKASKQRFVEFVKHTGREKPFLQACRISSLEKQTHLKTIVKRLIKKWEIEEETNKLRRGLLGGPSIEEAIDPSRFRIAYRGFKAHISVRSACNLTGGGLFDILDPYAILRFRNSKQPAFRTGVLQDAGADPVWDCGGKMLYNGETALEISVWDYETNSADDLLGTGVITVEQFCSGFEGMIPLALPGGKKKKTMKQMVIIIGIQWPPLEQTPSASQTWGTNPSNAITGGNGGTLVGFSNTR